MISSNHRFKLHCLIPVQLSTFDFLFIQKGFLLIYASIAEAHHEIIGNGAFAMTDILVKLLI